MTVRELMNILQVHLDQGGGDDQVEFYKDFPITIPSHTKGIRLGVQGVQGARLIGKNKV
jgi:hypothetical protein